MISNKNIRKIHEKIIGIISDTHGLLRPQALNALGDSDIIIHAGDIGSADVIKGLEEIAPLYSSSWKHGQGFMVKKARHGKLWNSGD